MNVQLNLLVFGLSYLIVALMACLGNLYGIRKIYEMMKHAKRKDKSAFRRTNLYLLLHMSSSDMLTGGLATPFTALTLLFQAFGDDSSDHFWLHTVLCNISGFVQCTMSRVTIIFAMGLVILRAMAIYLPKLISEDRFLKGSRYVVYLTWLICLLMSSIPFFKGVHYKYNRNYEMGWWNLDEVFQFKQGVFVGYLVVDTIPFAVPGVVVFVGTAVVIVGLRRVQKSSKEKQATLTTLMVAGLFLISYGMWWITSVVTICKLVGWISKTPKAFHVTLGEHNLVMMFSHGFLVYLNAALNPILYHFRLFKNIQKRKNGGMTISSFDKLTSLKTLMDSSKSKTMMRTFRSLSTSGVPNCRTEVRIAEGGAVRRVRSQHGEHSKPQHGESSKPQRRLSRSFTSSLQRYFKHHAVAPESKKSSQETSPLEEGFAALNESSGVMKSTDFILDESEKCAQKESFLSDSETDNCEVMSFSNKVASPNSGLKKVKRKVTFNDSSRRDQNFVRIKVIKEATDPSSMTVK
ncbi:hypothetical protein ACHWQZ_G003380 [Mnemiopsis leidyi]